MRKISIENFHFHTWGMDDSNMLQNILIVYGIYGIIDFYLDICFDFK